MDTFMRRAGYQAGRSSDYTAANSVEGQLIANVY